MINCNDWLQQTRLLSYSLLLLLIALFIVIAHSPFRNKSDTLLYIQGKKERHLVIVKLTIEREQHRKEAMNQFKKSIPDMKQRE